MSKKNFIESYATLTGETKKRSEELVNYFLQLVEEKLVSGEEIQFVGWGSFKVQKREGRKGINPSTKSEITIPAKNVVKFKVGKKLADKVAETTGKKSNKK